ncbi:uncharacterized protein LOC125727619 [Brienomyrus brachyistius]|uniref:uncharacterized protein LOC125727409 n=1 Tax=Brienomyrus brachyistius TaxID=42636 RepID=UPI0020B1A614|nr:uncharacterized protein LOC125727409 [Brienomyrus brachyistius]XP_048860421.1 uncharacterized protein LOC125727619 [Brienomyrus brachyistius]
MCYSIKRLLSVYMSLLLLSHEVFQAEEITGTVGQEVRLNFTRQIMPTVVKTVSLYKDGKKIGECSHAHTNCIFTRGLLTNNSQGAIVSISNLTMADSGNYSVTFFYNSPFFHESNSVSLVVHFQELTTDSSPPYRSNGNEFQEATSESFLYVYIIIALCLISVMMPSVLLSFFYQTPKRSSDHHQRPSSSNEFQVPSEAAVSVCPMEYVTLDFPSSLNVDEKAKWKRKAVMLQDTVEYATIIVPQG